MGGSVGTGGESPRYAGRLCRVVTRLPTSPHPPMMIASWLLRSRGEDATQRRSRSLAGRVASVASPPPYDPPHDE